MRELPLRQDARERCRHYIDALRTPEARPVTLEAEDTSTVSRTVKVRCAEHSDLLHPSIETRCDRGGHIGRRATHSTYRVDGDWRFLLGGTFFPIQL
jgi:hypothetical protein